LQQSFGTFIGSDHTAGATFPPEDNSLYILVKVEVRFVTNIRPQRHRTALKDDNCSSGCKSVSILSASISLNPIISVNPKDAVLYFATFNICGICSSPSYIRYLVNIRIKYLTALIILA
jgi:hypothetical protein